MFSNSDLSPNDSTKNGSLREYQIDFIIGVNQRQIDFENPKLKFFVKLKNKKYADCIWISKSELESIPNFKTKLIDPFQFSLKRSILSPVPLISSLYKPDNISFDETFCCPETILSDKKVGDKLYYLVKWENLGIDQSTWEDNSDQCIPPELINDYKLQIKNANPVDNQTTESFQNPSQFIPYSESPVYKNDNKLTTQQLDGLNWLIDKWYNNRNSILADVHGNSKTVQCITFIEEINRLTGYQGPYLIITSISTIIKWRTEFQKWTDLRVIEYIGSAKELKMMYDYALFADENKSFIKQDIVITSIEFFSSNVEVFNSIKWISIFIDKLLPENLDNPYFELIEGMCGHLILIMDDDLASYPIMTIYSIFHIIENETFSDLQSFIQLYSNQNSSLNIEQFQTLSQEYILRRNRPIFDPFDTDLPKKQEFLNEKEIVIQAEPSLFQLELYRKFFVEQRASFIFDDELQNNLFTLRKIANHPLLIREEFAKFKKIEKDDDEKAKIMVESSGKMIVLDKLLEKEKSLNKRVLILSNMKEMVNLIELYLQKKNYPYFRLGGSNGEVNKTNRNGYKTFCFLSSIDNFKTDFSETDTAIIYDSHFTPISLFDKANIYRLFTRGTVEEDLFIKFTVKKDFSPETKEKVSFMMRRNGYFAFHGQIDKSFYTEPIEKTVEYRTIYDLKNPECLNEKNFWLELFEGEDLAKIESIEIDTEKVKLLSKSIQNYGCFETQNRFHQDSSMNFILASVVYYLYRSIDKAKRTVFKYYIQKVRKISKDLIVCKESIQRKPFSDDLFVHELFGNDLYSSMLQIYSIDRLYLCLSFLSTGKINEIGFIFGQSMNIPIYWNDFYDYTLLHTSCMNGIEQSNVKLFQTNLEKVGILVGYLPSAKYTLNFLLEESETSQINLPKIEWLKSRISLIVSEMEMVIPDDFYPSIKPITPLEWTSFYRPRTSLHLETKNIVKRVLRVLFLFGFPLKKISEKVGILKRKMMLDPIPDEIIEAIIYSLIKEAANLVINSSEKQEFKSTEISQNSHEILLSLIQNLRPIRSIDITWVKREILLTLAKRLIFFVKLRDLSEKIGKNKIQCPGHPNWDGAPQWWDYSCNLELIRAVDSWGLSCLSCLKNLKGISSKLSGADREEIKNFRVYEKKVLGEVKCDDLPRSLRDLSFLLKIDDRVLILQKLICFLSVPNINSISCFLPVNQMAGLIVIDIGSKNNNGYPIGYYSIRFYRGSRKSDSIPLKSSSSSIQFSKNSANLIKENSKLNDNRNYVFYSFFCMVKGGCNGFPLFVIRNQDENPTKFFEVRGFSVNQVYTRFKEMLLCKDIEFPPPYFDGYEFFGFKNNVVRSFISST